MRSGFLDYLRAFSAIAVWLFHLKWFEYGYLGVPIFFAISGFVIAHSAQDRDRYTFLTARLARLWPAFLLCMVLTIIALGEVPSPLQLVANVTMAPMALGQAPFDPVYWSLMFEILFYAYVGALLVGPRLTERLHWFCWVWLALCAAHLFYPLPGKVMLGLEWGAYFCVGCAAWLMQRQVSGAIPLWLASTVVATVAAGMQTRFDPIVAGTIVCSFALAFPWLAANRPSTAIGLVLGAMSYPLYLLHHTFGGAVQQAWGLAASVVVVLLASWVVTYIEPYGSAAVKGVSARLRTISIKPLAPI